jgi:hypothetical protein
MNDRPTAVELVNAVRHYLESELLPTLTDARLKFQTLIAANVLSIAERELRSEEADLADEFVFYMRLLKLDVKSDTWTEFRTPVRKANELLCDHIRRGDYDEPARFASLAKELRRFIERKLQVANPRYLAATQALKETKS